MQFLCQRKFIVKSVLPIHIFNVTKKFEYFSILADLF